jgi:hypothetical protein
MKPVSDFFSRIQSFVMNCPEPTLQQAVIDTCIEFAEDTRAIREMLSPMYTEPGVPGYPLDDLNQARVGHVLQVHVDGARINGELREVVEMARQGKGRPTKFYTRRMDGELLLYFDVVPDDVYRLDVLVSSVPDRNASQVDDEYVERFMQPIVVGAIGMLKLQSGMSWTDPATGTAAREQFLQGVTKFKVQSNQGQVQSSMRVKPRKF